MKRLVRIINAFLLIFLLILTGFSIHTVRTYNRISRLENGSNSVLKGMQQTWFVWKHDLYHCFETQTSGEQVQLVMKPEKYQNLISSLPWSGQKYKKAVWIIDGDTLPIKLKLHGDGTSHFIHRQKSFKVKVRKNVYEGNNVYHLVMPKGDETINHLIGYKMAKIMGVLSPESRLISLRINSEDQGMKLMVEDLNECFLRKNNLIPGDLYSGELFGFKDRYYGLFGTVYDGAYSWKKKAKNNHYQPGDNTPLSTFLEQIHANNFDLVDLEAFARYSVFLDVSNSYHIDTQHNWRLYYDPVKQKMIPIVWDPLSFFGNWELRKNNQERQILLSRILARMYTNYTFLYHRRKALNQFYKEDLFQLRNMIKAEADTALALIKTSDRSPGISNTNLSKDEIINRLNHFLSLVDSSAETNKRQLYHHDPYLAWTKTEQGIRIKVHTQIPLDRLVIETNNKSVLKDSFCQIRYELDNEEQTTIQKLRINEESLVEMQHPLFSNIHVKRRFTTSYMDYRADLVFDTATYDLIFENMQIPDVVAIRGYFLDLRGSSMDFEKVQSIQPIGFHGVQSVLGDEIPSEPSVWKGTININQDTTIRNPVWIMPGTNIRIKDSVTVVFKNRITAKGQADKPITVTSQSVKPFGSFVLTGKRASNSEFRYCNFEHGSGKKQPLYEYSGMVCLHDVDSVKMFRCNFRNSNYVDDMVHLVYSSVLFSSCTFTNSFSDALDADISDLVLLNCSFFRCGNDGLDLMHTKASLNHCVFENCADKGVSVGERSRATLDSCRIEGNSIGIAVKDESEVTVQNTTIVQNKTGIMSFHKNKKYSGPGKWNLINTGFISNTTDSLRTFTPPGEP